MPARHLVTPGRKGAQAEFRVRAGLAVACSNAGSGHAVKHYREVFAPRMLRPSTFSVADGHLKVHLEADWNDIPVEHIHIDAVNEWIWRKTAREFVLGHDQEHSAHDAAGSFV